MKTQKILKLYRLCAFIITILLTSLRIMSLFNSYDLDTGYFDKTPLTVISDVLAIIAAIFCFVPLLTIPRKKITSELIPITVKYRLFSSVSAIATIIAVFLIALSAPDSLLEKSVFILTIISALFFILGISKSNNHAIYKAFLSIVCIALYIAILATTYFDLRIAMNSPHKIYGSIALMAAMFLMLGEARIQLGMATPRAHLAFSTLTFILCTSQVISAYVFSALADISDFELLPIMLGNTGYIVVLTAAAVYSVARFTDFTEVKEISDPDVVEE